MPLSLLLDSLPWTNIYFHSSVSQIIIVKVPCLSHFVEESHSCLFRAHPIILVYHLLVLFARLLYVCQRSFSTPDKYRMFFVCPSLNSSQLIKISLQMAVSVLWPAIKCHNSLTKERAPSINSRPKHHCRPIVVNCTKSGICPSWMVDRCSNQDLITNSSANATFQWPNGQHQMTSWG